uniref:Transmembrane protein 65 n=1 Tax=Denticeps clupeoides TaxID=299321 RepID=A0AAY4CND8_9TELE
MASSGDPFILHTFLFHPLPLICSPRSQWFERGADAFFLWYGLGCHVEFNGSLTGGRWRWRPDEKLEASPPSAAQVRYVLLHNAIPFVGFGFLDNAIMIAAGTQIEVSIGVTFGISTMAAAALGNLVSDLAGLGLAGYVEALASRLGMQIPDLTPKQADMWQTRLSSHMGKAIGVTIGCILGMFPLLFLKDEDEEGKET